MLWNNSHGMYGWKYMHNYITVNIFDESIYWVAKIFSFLIPFHSLTRSNEMKCLFTQRTLILLPCPRVNTLFKCTPDKITWDGIQWNTERFKVISLTSKQKQWRHPEIVAIASLLSKDSTHIAHSLQSSVFMAEKSRATATDLKMADSMHSVTDPSEESSPESLYSREESSLLELDLVTVLDSWIWWRNSLILGDG